MLRVVTKSVVSGTCCKLFSVLDDKCWRPERKIRVTLAYKMCCYGNMISYISSTDFGRGECAWAVQNLDTLGEVWL